jgi:hypothetical protein
MHVGLAPAGDGAGRVGGLIGVTGFLDVGSTGMAARRRLALLCGGHDAASSVMRAVARSCHEGLFWQSAVPLLEPSTLHPSTLSGCISQDLSPVPPPLQHGRPQA